MLTSRRALGPLILAAFLGVSVFGIVDSGMMDHGDMNTGCVFMLNEHAICTMTPLEHLSLWQAAMSSIPAMATTVALLALLLVGLVKRLSWLLSSPAGPLFNSFLIFAKERRLFLQFALTGATVSPRAP